MFAVAWVSGKTIGKADVSCGAGWNPFFATLVTVTLIESFDLLLQVAGRTPGVVA